MKDILSPERRSQFTVDSHQHFWRFDAQRDVWITEAMSNIRKDFLPEDLKPILDAASMDGCVAVQADESEQENEFLLELARQNSWIKGIVGWLDFTSNDISARLEYYSQFPTIKGFRYILQGNPKRDLMLTGNFLKNIGLLEKCNYTYDILIFPDQLQYAEKLVAQFPKQKFVLDHLGKPDLKEEYFSNWTFGIEKLAQYDNVFCKVSGMVTEADWYSWDNANYQYVLDVVTKSFGTNRLLFGSDWPVCQLATSYFDVKRIVEQYYEAFSEEDRNKIFGGNAVRFYGL
ncbi:MULTISPECIES: amidohydrolase family protein [Chitinophagaceae]